MGVKGDVLSGGLLNREISGGSQRGGERLMNSAAHDELEHSWSDSLVLLVRPIFFVLFIFFLSLIGCLLGYLI